VLYQVQRRVELLTDISLRKTADISPWSFPGVITAIEKRADELDGCTPKVDKDIGSQPVLPETASLLKAFIVLLGLVSTMDEVDKITASGRCKRVSSYCVSLTSHWCFNHGKDHGSNRSYVIVSISWFSFSLLLLVFV
jgi:hypothetical protein